jgi:ABC-type transport system involved in multi-copper enzyme maturation permease subunit
LTTLFTVIFVILLYRFLPELESGDVLPRVVIFDQGQSQFAAAMADDQRYDVVNAPTQDQMAAYLANESLPILGLVLPEDFDEQVKSGEITVLPGFSAHWLGDQDLREMRTFFEDQLAEVSGRPIQLDLTGNQVYSRLDSQGRAFMTSAGIVVVTIMIGLFLTPQLILEEKQNKTLNLLLVSPLSSGQIVVSKALTGLFYCLTAGLILLVVNKSIVVNWWLAIIALVLGSLFGVALGLLLGAALERPQQLRLWAFIAIQPIIFTLFLPIFGDMLPEGVLEFLRWTPMVVWSTVIRASFAESTPLSHIGLELALLVGYVLLLLALAIWFVSRSDRR